MVTDSDGETWLTPQEAADFIGISVSRIYHLVDRLSHVKSGSCRSGRVYFRKSRLWDDYTK